MRSLEDDFLAGLATVDVPARFSPFTIATGTAAAPGTGNRRSLRNRADSAPAKIMQANRYYPQRYRKSSE